MQTLLWLIPIFCPYFVVLTPVIFYLTFHYMSFVFKKMYTTIHMNNHAT